MKEDVKIAYFEGLIADPEKMNKCIFNVIESADFNNDDQISRTEFKKVLEDFGVAVYEAVDDLFDSLDRDGNGHINFNEFKPFFRAQTKIKLAHLRELKQCKEKGRAKLAAEREKQNVMKEEESSSSTATDEEKKPKGNKKKGVFGRFKSSRY